MIAQTSSHSSVFVSQIQQICQNPTYEKYLRFIQGEPNTLALRAVEPQLASPDSLCFVSTAEDLNKVLTSGASIIVALDKLNLTKISLTKNQALFSAAHVGAAMTLILPLLDQKKSRFPIGIHAQSFVDPTAKLGAGASIGPFAVIGAFAEIGEGTAIGAHSVVETGAQIGAKTILHPQVFIGAHCRIGNFCEIHPHTTIGSDGFGFVQGPDLRRNKIPQLGIVVIEDSVEIGANCAIDRATLNETRIGEGSKFDNFCHVAHNCTIGKNNVFAGGFMIAGSSRVGDNCMSGGGTFINDHVEVGNNIIFGGRSSVSKDVLKPGAYTGYPLEPMRDALRTLANLVHLTSMRKQLAQIRKHLGLQDE